MEREIKWGQKEDTGESRPKKKQKSGIKHKKIHKNNKHSEDFQKDSPTYHFSKTLEYYLLIIVLFAKLISQRFSLNTIIAARYPVLSPIP